MSGRESGSNVMVSWYRDRIAEPSTDDEVYGYWLFVLGIVLGVLGIGVFLTSDGTGAPLGYAIVLTAVALVLLVVGPVVRLPIERTATVVAYAGALVSFAAVAWFFVAYPSSWPEQSRPIVGMYAAGLAVIATGAAVVPLLSRNGKTDLPGDDIAAASTEEVTAADDDEPPESKAEFELYVDRAGKWRWRLRHRNGNVIADGGQGYSSRQKAEQGLESVKTNSPGAGVTRVESDDEAEPAESVEPYAPEDVQASFEIYEDRGGEWRWRLRHDNGEIIADGGQGYASRDGLVNALDGIREYVSAANYLDVTPAAFEVYEDAGGAWRWRLVHQNGNVIADGGEGYASRGGARDGVESVRNAVADGADAFEVYQDAADEWRWRLRHGNGEILADSGEGYASERGVREAVERVVEYAPEADALDYSVAAFEVFKDRGGEWRWRLRHRNGEIMADGGEGYSARGKAHDGVDSVKRNAPNAEVAEIGGPDESSVDEAPTDDSPADGSSADEA